MDIKYYYAYLYLGNPAKRQSYIVDTGSSITTSPCQPYCTHCGKHENSYFNVKSNQLLKCELCQSIKNGDFMNKSCHSEKINGKGYEKIGDKYEF